MTITFGSVDYIKVDDLLCLTLVMFLKAKKVLVCTLIYSMYSILISHATYQLIAQPVLTPDPLSEAPLLSRIYQV